jgi:hypothetical protein
MVADREGGEHQGGVNFRSPDERSDIRGSPSARWIPGYRFAHPATALPLPNQLPGRAGRGIDVTAAAMDERQRH